MKRVTAALLIATATICAPAVAVKKHVVVALQSIEATESGNVFSRMKKCGIHIQEDSWADEIQVDTDRGDRKGDFIVWAFIDVPAPTGWPKQEFDTFKSLNAAWRKRDGRYEPITGWARKIQLTPYPMEWLKC